MTTPTERQLRRLTHLQYSVTQNKKTEPAFSGIYHDFFEMGLYVDVVSGTPLFSSADKFQSEFGWASFSRPIMSENVMEDRDTSNGKIRVEVLSSSSCSHLGHVYDDGPKSIGGLRYSINSAALKFISISEIEQKGYGEYKKFVTM